jgi:phytoene desaturase
MPGQGDEVMPEKIAVVGAGVGGLATAARLAKKGYSVEVFEKLSNCGGRNNLLEDRGFKFDLGPSFVLMPDFFEEVFTYCGQDLRQYLDLKVLDVNYKIFYPDGDSLTVYRDTARTKEELEKFEKGSSASFDNFIRETERIYRSVKPLLYKCFTLKQLSNPAYWPLLTKIRPFESYWQLARRFFKSEKLCFAFTFEAMFMGVSPYQAPAFYSVITYADHVQKIRHPMGGMYQIPLSLEKLAGRFNARFHYSCEVKKIKKVKGRFLLDFDHRQVEADKVVINGDYAYAQTDLLGRRIPRYKYSCSVYLIYLGLKNKVPGLEHHNLFFSADLKKNLRQIFQGKVMPDDPSFYIHVPTVTDASLAPKGKDIVYILIPVPNLENNKDDIMQYEERLRKVVFDKVKKTIGMDLKPLIEVESRFYPQDFTCRYNLKYGATFGLAHNLMQSAFLRPANVDPRLKGLYFVGASTQPGGGLPVVIASSKIVADNILSRH